MHTTKHLLPVLTAVTLLLAAPAFAQQATPVQNSMQGTQRTMRGGTRSPADTAMMAGMEKMQHDMSAAPMTGDADKDFVAMMISHHQGAIDMAKVELQYGKDPEMMKLASAIIAAQNEEIAQMRKWQAQHPSK